MHASNLIVVLGDQLSTNLASIRAGDPSRDRILMAEVVEEATYVGHHQKKIAFVFSAMRHFAQWLREAGWTVDYTLYDDPGNTGSLTAEVKRAIARHRPDAIIAVEPGEWRLRQAMDGWTRQFDCPVRILEDDRFVCSHGTFQAWAVGRKQLRMEFFYRQMRRQTGLLMAGDEPEGGRWNFDADNRKPPKAGLSPLAPLAFEPDEITRVVLALVSDRFSHHFGRLHPFRLAVTAEQADAAFEHFVDHLLPSFGDYQDAMLAGQPFLFHAMISLYLNVGLLDPLQVCRRVERAYCDGAAPLNAAEGFIRQIIGWREYVRGIYWLRMPSYRDENFFEARRNLPDFYWTGKTEMACMAAVIGQTRDEAYAHHIQRLMITGNFALLAGIEPRQVHEWYLAVYADAYEWVELPNTLGMSQFADGGVLASKPYAASGNYINRMSDYCGGCPYDVKRKTGEGACPFNALYWDFLARNETRLRGNPRLAQIYRSWDRMDEERQAAYRASAADFLKGLDQPST